MFKMEFSPSNFTAEKFKMLSQARSLMQRLLRESNPQYRR
jgi:hypothetical protein